MVGKTSDIRNSRIANIMELKPQDLLVLLKAAAHPEQRWTYAALGIELGMSASEVHASVKRAVAAGLAVMPGRGDWSPVRPALIEFVVHGARYAFPAVLGPVKRGVPTSIGAPPLDTLINSAVGDAPVWPHPQGSVRGPTVSPLYRSAPDAALLDPGLHSVLALLDAIRAGRARERALATELLTRKLEKASGETGDAG
ncbi:hypothetical protein [Ramlibacter sp.]|uniref:hypothetical protein n=1 Tax=Ramlibacter sp. TaxID=1917967 RepID=UPI003D0DF7F5